MTGDSVARTQQLTWVPAVAARRALILAGLALASAFWFDRPLLIGLAAPPLMLLFVVDSRPRPSRATITVEHPDRCFEGEPIEVRITVRLDAPAGYLHLQLGSPSADRPRQTRARGVAELSWTIRVVAGRWGTRPVGLVEIRLWDRRRLTTCRLWAWPDHELRVYPRPAPVRRPRLNSTRFDRAGDHPAATAGAGVEFESVRPFTGGDRPREVNWPVSTRRGALYVTTRRAERAVDVVIAVDVLAEVGAPDRSSRDLALTGAAGFARAVLKLHDRVGLVAVGGRLQWLTPQSAERQFYRIVDALLDVTDWFSYLDPDVDTIPYPALPAGAWVVYFSPLIDPRGIAAAQRLRARGHPVTVVDVCRSEPTPSDQDETLDLRLWRLDRLATARRLAATGVQVVSWDGQAPLEAVLTTAGPAARAYSRR